MTITPYMQIRWAEFGEPTMYGRLSCYYTIIILIIITFHSIAIVMYRQFHASFLLLLVFVFLNKCVCQCWITVWRDHEASVSDEAPS